jgi:hypothetical protein
MQRFYLPNYGFVWPYFMAAAMGRKKAARGFFKKEFPAGRRVFLQLIHIHTLTETARIASSTLGERDAFLDAARPSFIHPVLLSLA